MANHYEIATVHTISLRDGKSLRDCNCTHYIITRLQLYTLYHYEIATVHTISLPDCVQSDVSGIILDMIELYADHVGVLTATSSFKLFIKNHIVSLSLHSSIVVAATAAVLICVLHIQSRWFRDKMKCYTLKVLNFAGT